MTAPYTTDWQSYSEANPELEKLLESHPVNITSFFTEQTPPQALRRAPPPTDLWPGISENDIQIPVRDGTSNRARVYRSSETTEKGPLLVMAFGGGFVLGSLESEEENCRNWVKKFGGTAVSISYRLAPENPWPTGVEDVYDAVKWVASNYEELGADPNKGFVIGGISSGSTAMCTVSHLARDENLTPPLTGLYLSVPAMCLIPSLPDRYHAKEKAWEQNKDNPIYNRHMSDWLAKKVQAGPQDPLRSPLIWPTGHKNLPPTYFLIAGADIWRDIGLIYEEILREENGIATKVDVFPGLPHGFFAMFPTAEFVKVHAQKSEAGFEWLLEQSKNRRGA